MIIVLIDWLKRLFGLNKKTTHIDHILEKKEVLEKKLKDIDNEDTDIDSIINDWNKK